MNPKNDRRNFLKNGAILTSILLLGNTTKLMADDTSKAIESIFDVFKLRRSVRKYKSTPVPQEHIEKILKAACSAPNSGNQQPWKFLVIQKKETIQNLKTACIDRSLKHFKDNGNPTNEEVEERSVKINDYYSNCFSAPAYIVVLTDNESKYPDYNHLDGPLAAGYLILAARALGYGTVHYTDSIPDEVTKKVLNIPEKYTRVCITPVGVPVEWPDSPPKKKLEEMVSYEEL